MGPCWGWALKLHLLVQGPESAVFQPLFQREATPPRPDFSGKLPSRLPRAGLARLGVSVSLRGTLDQISCAFARAPAPAWAKPHLYVRGSMGVACQRSTLWPQERGLKGARSRLDKAARACPCRLNSPSVPPFRPGSPSASALLSCQPTPSLSPVPPCCLLSSHVPPIVFLLLAKHTCGQRAN